MKIFSFLPAMLLASGFAVATSVVAPAQAITLTQVASPGFTTSNPPNQPVYQANIQASDIGKSFDINWFLGAGYQPLTQDISATSNWKITSFSNSQIGLEIKVSNTTQLTSLANANITSFGFGIDPNATATFAQAGAIFDNIGTGQGGQQNYPGGFKAIDICIYADGCNGGNVNNGLVAGATDTIKLALTGSFGGGASLQFFPVKFQTSAGSYELAGQPTAVPEPITILGLGVGTIGGGLLKRKFGNKAKATA
jgi:hypothetical protein